MPRSTTAIVALMLAVAAAAVTGAQSPDSPTAPRDSAGAPPSTVPAPSPRSPRNANYTIEARLDPATHTLTGSEVITWRNITSQPTSELQFHLYWNAWTDERSTFLREQALVGRVSPPGADGSRIDIRRLVVTQGEAATDLSSHVEFIAPDDGNHDDRTVAHVVLPRAVAPGETVRIEVAWDSRVPRPFARTGYVGNFYFLAQWFPKLGVLQDSGWNCHQFHASTEFFSDYGTYDVRMSVPRGWIVAATGREQSQSDDGDKRIHRYVEEDVHDFAWTTSPEYIERTDRFDEPGLPPVDLRLLLQPEHVAQAERHFAAAKSTLRRFGAWFGPYPYGHLTIVDPAYRSEADGMEYPTLITAGTRWLVPSEVTINTPEEVVAHEAGHQFWYGLVGTNEFEDAWMDEGINTYATARSMAEDYPRSFHEARFFGGFVPWVFHDLPLTRETFWNRLAGYRLEPKGDAASTPAYRFFPATGRTITYNKTALWLNTLERWIGWPRLQAGMAAFFKNYEFSHPFPADFFATIGAAAGRDLTPFFGQVVGSSNVFDYALDRLSSNREGDHYRTVVIVRREGEAEFPVDVVTTFENGETTTEHWDGHERWHEYVYTKPSRARMAAVDPERTLLLDINVTNNSQSLAPQTTTAALKWSAKWMVWLQDAMTTWGMLL